MNGKRPDSANAKEHCHKTGLDAEARHPSHPRAEGGGGAPHKSTYCCVPVLYGIVIKFRCSEGGTSGEVERLPLHRVSTEGGIRDSRWRPGGDPVETRENGGSSKWSQSTALPNCSTCSVDHGGDGHHVGGQPTSPGYSLSGDGGSPGYPPCLSIRDSQWTPVENQWRTSGEGGSIVDQSVASYCRVATVATVAICTVSLSACQSA